jgi:hypothetical protein
MAGAVFPILPIIYKEQAITVMLEKFPLFTYANEAIVASLCLSLDI